jgi:hypothetical protein
MERVVLIMTVEQPALMKGWARIETVRFAPLDGGTGARNQGW